jgi:formylglycine-generating enzyme required for sulfatase activity
MSGKIFLSYRRDDAVAAAEKLRGGLTQAFGRKSLVKDMNDIPVGVDFVNYLEGQIAICNVFLAIIGPNWLEAQDGSGNRCIDDPHDFAVIEIAAALKRDIRVIPVLIDATPMPRLESLQEGLRPLLRRNPITVSMEHFDRDVSALIAKVRAALRETTGQRRVPPLALAGAGTFLAIVFGIYQFRDVPIPGKGKAINFDKLAEAAKPSQPAEIDKASVRPKSVEAQAAIEGNLRENAREAARLPRVFDEVFPKQVMQASTADGPFIALIKERIAALKAENEKRKPGSSVQLVTPVARKAFRDCADCPEMAVVPAGSFTMGSQANEPERGSWNRNIESPQHRVTISKPFAAGRFPVTFAEWDACAAENGCGGYIPSDQGWGRGARPVINVSWHDAKAYTAWLSKKTGKAYRLLSEAEREYVARAGAATTFWWGSSITPDQANYDGHYLDTGGGQNGGWRRQTVPVKSFEPNPWGLYQVHGNVWDWVEDCWNESYDGAPADGSAKTAGDCNYRVLRGGSWFDDPQHLRSAFRNNSSTDNRNGFTSFRVARPIAP